MPKATSHGCDSETVLPNSSPSKTPKRQTKKKAKLITDEASWSSSDIPEGRTINKTRARKEYKLSDKDIIDLPYVRVEDENVHGGSYRKPMMLYQEKDVELTAWRKYGGPQRFQAHLQERHAEWLSKGRKGAWSEPTKYGPSVEMVTQRPAGVPVDTWAETPELVRKRDYLKANGQLWVWDAYNKALDNALHCGEAARLAHSVPHQKRREAALCDLNRSSKYPPRPSLEQPASTSFDNLREVLEDAPVPQEPYVEVDGLDWHDHEDGETSIYWAEGYLNRLFTALNAVIDQHGPGENGWKRARWMVYDTYSESFAGINYHDGKMKVVDDAYEWLCGRLIHSENFAITTRMDERSELGKRYNGMLPWLSPGE